MEELELMNQTIEHYEGRADLFWEGTKDHDVSQNYEAFLTAIATKAPWQILDFGCGPGRDLLHFTQLGHQAVGLDGCESFCDMARKHSGCEVLQQNFSDLDLSEMQFDGIFANACMTVYREPRDVTADMTTETKDRII